MDNKGYSKGNIGRKVADGYSKNTFTSVNKNVTNPINPTAARPKGINVITNKEHEKSPEKSKKKEQSFTNVPCSTNKNMSKNSNTDLVTALDELIDRIKTEIKDPIRFFQKTNLPNKRENKIQVEIAKKYRQVDELKNKISQQLSEQKQFRVISSEMCRMEKFFAKVDHGTFIQSYYLNDLFKITNAWKCIVKIFKESDSYKFDFNSRYLDEKDEKLIQKILDLRKIDQTKKQSSERNQKVEIFPSSKQIQLNDMKKQIKLLSERIPVLKKSVQQEQKKLEDGKQKQSVLDLKYEQKKRQYDNDLYFLDNQKRKFQKEIEDLIKNIKEKKRIYQVELEKMKKEAQHIDDKEKQINTLKKMGDQLKNENQTHKKHRVELLKQLEDLRKTVQQNKSLKQSINQQIQKLAQKNEELSKSVKQRISFSHCIKNLQFDKKELTQKVKVLQQQNDKTKKDVSYELNCLKNQLSKDHLQDKRAFEQLLNDKSVQIELLESGHREEKKKLQAKINSQQQTSIKNQSIVKDQLIIIKNLEESLNKLREINEKNEVQINNLSQEKAKLDDQIFKALEKHNRRTIQLEQGSLAAVSQQKQHQNIVREKDSQILSLKECLTNKTVQFAEKQKNFEQFYQQNNKKRREIKKMFNEKNIQLRSELNHLKTHVDCQRKIFQEDFSQVNKLYKLLSEKHQKDLQKISQDNQSEKSKQLLLQQEISLKNRQYEKQISANKNKMDNFTLKIQQLERQLAIQQDKTIKFQINYDETEERAKQDGQSEELKKYSTLFQEQQILISQMEKQKHELAEQIQKLSKEQEVQKSTFEEKISSIEVELKEKDSQIEKIKESLLTSQNKLIQLETVHQKSQRENQILKQQSQKYEENKKELDEKLDQYRDRIKKYEEKQKDLERLTVEKQQIEKINQELISGSENIRKEEGEKLLKVVAIEQQLKQKNSKLEAHLLQAEEKLDKMNKQNKNMFEQTKSLRKEYQQAEVEIRAIENANKNLNAEKKLLQNAKEEIQRANKQLSGKIDLLHKEKKELKNETQKVKVQMKKKEDQFNQLLNSTEKLSNNLSQLTSEHEKLENQKLELEMKLLESTSQKSFPENQKQEEAISSTKNAQFEQKIMFIQRQKLQLKESIHNQQQKIEKLEEENLNLSEEMKNLQQKSQKLDEIDRQKQNLIEQNKQLTEELLSEKKRFKEVQSQIEQKQKRETNEKKGRAKSSIQPELYDEKEEEIIENRFKVELPQKSRSSIPLEEEEYSFEPVQVSIQNMDYQKERYLFHGDALRDRDEYKLFLKTSIQKNMRIKIKDTRLIHRYDPLSSTNIHRYIDNRENLVLIIKLINGYCIAGYYEGVFKPKTLANKQGLIISLTNQKVYVPNERNKKATVYDDFFVIWGNSQIRIKSQEKKAFSNFGLNNSYYRHKGDSVSMFLGGTPQEREMQFLHCQFYQLILRH